MGFLYEFRQYCILTIIHAKAVTNSHTIQRNSNESLSLCCWEYPLLTVATSFFRLIIIKAEPNGNCFLGRALFESEYSVELIDIVHSPCEKGNGG